MTLISATGNKSGKVGFTSLRRSAEHGFTLVELMVVLLIIGLAAGVVALAIPDPRGDIRADAERFGARVKAAQDKAVLDARDMAVWANTEGYGFEQRDRAGWQPVTAKPFERQSWSGGAQILVGEAGSGRAVFDVTGGAEPLDVTLMRDGVRTDVRIGADGGVHVVR